MSTKHSRSFASDNNAGIHPDILKAIVDANQGHVPAYGDDPYTARAVAAFRKHFGPETEVHFVFNGTGANVLGLQTLTSSYDAIFCAATAHIENDECGAPEKFTGCKLLTIDTPDGKLTPKLVAPHLSGVGDQHHVQPRVISISQTTEMGTVYTAGEVRALAEFAHASGMLLHMDGARISNAAASLGVSLRAITVDAGVDVLSFGGTKNGLMLGEAVVMFKPELARNFKFTRKQGMQLSSKMRFIAAQFEALLSNDLWLSNASHANAMAQRLFAKLADVRGVRVTQKVQANAIFAEVPPAAVALIQKQYHFYVWRESTSEVRWMASWDTTESDVDGMIAAIRGSLAI